MKTTENYLEVIQEDQLQEIDPLTGSAIIASVLIIKELIMFFMFVASMAATTKVDPKLTKELKGVLQKMGVRKDFKVHVVQSKVPNAFTPGGKHVYITSGLLKLLAPRESMAVLLHEVYHAIDWHVWKRMAAEFPLYYIAVPIAVAAAIASGPLAIITGILVFAISLSILKIPMKRIMGRKQELQADNYAVKAGYGKDMAGALSKIERMIRKMEAGRSCGPVCKVVGRIEQAMDEHPPLKQRIEQAMKDTELLKAMAKGKLTTVTYKIKKLFGKGD
jgi:Zn-dependent protease with chaperone function